MNIRYPLTLAVSILATGIAVAQENAESWSLSAGVGVRQLETQFKSTAPASLDWGNLIRVNHNVGSIELYKGDGAVVQYGNGSVGIFDFEDGTCTFMADSPAQLGINPNASSRVRASVREISFQSDRYNYSAEVSQPGMDVSDDDISATPYIALRYKGLSMWGGNLGFLAQYALARGDFSSGNRITASAVVKQTHDQYTIAYDIDEFYVGGTDIAAQIPLVNPALGIDGVVWNATQYNTDGFSVGENSQDPRISKMSHVSEWASYNAITKSSLKINLHELALAPEWRQQAKRFSWGLAVGPTLNLIDSDFDSVTQWVRQDTGAVVAAGRNVSSSDQDFKLGVMASVSIACNLDKNGRFFAEAAGSYHWLDELDLGKGADQAIVDASSAEASLGLGVRL